jgi:hypothetical protein
VLTHTQPEHTAAAMAARIMRLISARVIMPHNWRQETAVQASAKTVID